MSSAIENAADPSLAVLVRKSNCTEPPPFVEIPDAAYESDAQRLGRSAQLGAVSRPVVSREEMRYTFSTADELANRPIPAYRIKDVLPRDGVAAVFGPSTDGKSFVVLDLAFALADGRDFFGYRVKPCDVLYIALEGGAGMSKRVRAYKKQYGATCGERLHFLTLPFVLLYSDDVDDLVAAVREAGIRDGLIVIDTLNAAIPGGDENGSVDMGRAIQAAKRIGEECGGIVVLIHHSGKDPTKGLRGHSSLFAALDTVIEVSRTGDHREWKLNKAKDGKEGVMHSFRLEVIEVGTDEDGEPVTSCVVVPTEDAVQTVRRALPPKSGNQRIIWDALGEIFRISSTFGEFGAPPGRPCIRLTEAIEAVRGKLPVEPKRQTERTQSAITGLVGRGLLEHQEGWIWCT